MPAVYRAATIQAVPVPRVNNIWFREVSSGSRRKLSKARRERL